LNRQTADLNIIPRTALVGGMLIGEMGLWIRCSQVFALPHGSFQGSGMKMSHTLRNVV
jgi:hypothetical protein